MPQHWRRASIPAYKSERDVCASCASVQGKASTVPDTLQLRMKTYNHSLAKWLKKWEFSGFSLVCLFVFQIQDLVLPFRTCRYAAMVLHGTCNTAAKYANIYFTERWPKTPQKKRRSYIFCKSFLSATNIALGVGEERENERRKMTKWWENKTLHTNFSALGHSLNISLFSTLIRV